MSLESYHDFDSLQNSVNELQIDADSKKIRTPQKKRSQDSNQAIDHGYDKMLQPNRETRKAKVQSTPIKTQAESPVKDDSTFSPPIIITAMQNIRSPTMRHRQLKISDKSNCETKLPKVTASGL